ncbi:MAG: DUF350 domain-containing protein [Elusimicrobia bacterium]|nr:DUF350 domain-containing protein [Elusimicrobiota bacterium]
MIRDILDPTHIAAAVIYSFIGLGVFIGSFYVFDRATPYDLWHELVGKQNRALATVLAGVAVAIGMIIAASILG